MSMEDANGAAPEAATLPAGTRLGKYELVRLLGAGGMGAVYEGIHTDMGKRVAIKTLSPAVAEIPGARARFLREAQLTSKVRHPHIVDVSDVGTEGGHAFLVMELLRGEDLSHRLERTGPLAPRELADIMLPVCSALVAAHDATIVHRDLKPHNIFLATGPHGIEPKVLDFGISKSADGLTASALTRTGSVIGTPYYLAPEQIQDARAATPSSDQYALGVILYECLSGRRPFEGESLFSVFNAIINERPEPLVSRRPDLPPGLERVVDRAMSAESAKRYPSVRALGRALLPFASPKAQVVWGDAFGPAEAEPEPPPAAARSSVATTPYDVAVTPAPRERVSLPHQNTLSASSGQSLAGELMPEPPRSRGRVVLLGVLAATVIGGVAAFALRSGPGAAPRPIEAQAAPPAAAPEKVAPAAAPVAAPPPPVAAPPEPVAAPPEPRAAAAPEPAPKRKSPSAARRRGAAVPAAAPEAPANNRRSFNPNGAPVID
jgi:serine/threonine-protein kinase